MTLVAPQERSPILGALRLGLHAMFALLLGLGLLRTFTSDTGVFDPPMSHQLVITGLVVVLAILYVLGTSHEYRTRLPPTTDASPSKLREASRFSRKLELGWLATITVLWFVLLLFSADFVWVAFPFMFLYLYLLGTISGVIAVVALWTATWAIPWWYAGTTTGPQPPDVAAMVGSGIGAVVAVLVFTAYRHLLDQAVHHQRVAAALQAAQADLAATQHRAGQLEERQRLAGEIHDTLAQGFSSIVLVSRAAIQHSPSLSDPVKRALETVEETAATNLTEARGFVQHLTTADPQVSLPQQLQRLAARVETELAVRKQPLAVQLRWEGSQPPATLPEPIGSAVLRAVQVGLGNVSAHAQASRAVVTVSIWPQELTVDIYDDGVGFTVPNTFRPGFSATFTNKNHADDAAQQDTGFGLYGLHQRLGSLDGTLAVESTPGQGTVLTARIPLTNTTPTAKESP